MLDLVFLVIKKADRKIPQKLRRKRPRWSRGHYRGKLQGVHQFPQGQGESLSPVFPDSFQQPFQQGPLTRGNIVDQHEQFRFPVPRQESLEVKALRLSHGVMRDAGVGLSQEIRRVEFCGIGHGRGRVLWTLGRYGPDFERAVEDLREPLCRSPGQQNGELFLKLLIGRRKGDKGRKLLFRGLYPGRHLREERRQPVGQEAVFAERVVVVAEQEIHILYLESAFFHFPGDLGEAKGVHQRAILIQGGNGSVLEGKERVDAGKRLQGNHVLDAQSQKLGEQAMAVQQGNVSQGQELLIQ